MERAEQARKGSAPAREAGARGEALREAIAIADALLAGAAAPEGAMARLGARLDAAQREGRGKSGSEDPLSGVGGG